MSRVLRLGALIALVTVAIVPASPATAREVGISDQHATTFSNPRFRALRVRIARLVVSYDAVLHQTPEARQVDAWISAAERARIEPLIAFQHVRGCYVGRHGHIPHLAKCHLPTVAEFRRAFEAFRSRYPVIREYSPWNEANHWSQPTHDNPRRAAEYYNVVRADCPRCTIVAADVLDAPHFTGWLARFRRWAHGSPRIWGLHNYHDANRHTTLGTRRMLGAVRGQVWFTETGGIVHFPHWPFSPRRAAEATRFVLKLARLSPRITRVYIYEWTGGSRRVRWDSGLMAPDGRPRPAYWVVKAYLDRANRQSRMPLLGR